MMKNRYSSLASLALTLWVGGLISIGYLAVPILFSAQPDKQLAGRLAGEMFHALGYLGMVCGLIVLTHALWVKEQGKQRSKIIWLVGTMLLLSLIIQFGISPHMAELKQLALPEDVMHSVYAERFKALHGVSSILYLLECLLGSYAVIQSTSKASTPSNDAV